MSISLIKSLTSVCTRNTLSMTVPCCIRCFSDTPVKKAAKSTVKPPSSRKIARDNRKKLLQQEIEQYKKLDEIALKSGFPAPWKYYAAAIIDREPQVLPPLEDWQQKMQDIWEERYNANAKKVEPFLNMLKPIEEKKVDENDIVEEEIPVSYETEDDKNKVMTSLNRSLTRYLYLVVNRPTKHVLGSGWSFPMIEYNKEEHPTMRDAAEDVATAAVGKHMKLYFLGNAPVGYIAYGTFSNE